MRKWFLRQAFDAGLSLTREQSDCLSARVQQLFSFERGSTMLRMIPGYVAILAIPFMSHIQNVWGLPWRILAAVAVSVAGLFLSFLLIRRAYVKYTWRALRELALADICSRCGYPLEQLAQDADRCPECGMRTVLMPHKGCELKQVTSDVARRRLRG